MGRPALYFLSKAIENGSGFLALNPTAAKVAELIREPIESLGFELWDVRFVKEGASWYLRVFIDKADGINIDNCSEVSHLIDPIIDEADPINVSYYLEVCSPGLERELTEPQHFTKYYGENVKIKLIRPKDGKREFCGKLLAYDGGITAICDGEEMYFAKNELVNVRLDDADF